MLRAFPLFGCLLFSKVGSLLWPSWALQNIPCGPKVTWYHTCCWLFYCYQRASPSAFNMFHLQLKAVQPGPTEVFPTAVAQSQRWLLSVRGHGLPPVRDLPELSSPQVPAGHLCLSTCKFLPYPKLNTTHLKLISPPHPHPHGNPPSHLFVSVKDTLSPQVEGLGASSSSYLDSVFGTIKLSPYKSSQI